MYQKFAKKILWNYFIVSLIAVSIVGSIFIFTTLDIKASEIGFLIIIVMMSIFIMAILDLSFLKYDLRPIKNANRDLVTFEELKIAYKQVHRLPKLAVRRVMLPHFIGFSGSAVLLAFIFISNGWLDVSTSYIMFAFLGALLVALMHALIEYYLTLDAIKPMLSHLRNKANKLYGRTLNSIGKKGFPIKRSLISSAIVISVSPLLLFTIAAQVRIEEFVPELSATYWIWAIGIILISIMFSVVAALLIAKSIQVPINELQQKMKLVQGGEFDVEASDNYPDDFAKLVNGFNHMVSSLNQTDAVNRQLLDSFITTLTTALDARDPYTAGHSKRVSDLSVAIGEKLRLSQPKISLLRKTALLHDIGKIGIEDDILLKSGKLTEREFNRIKEHPVLGENILKQVKPLTTIAAMLPGVRSHHERMDGLGYPDQLKGEEIPLFGRIIAVADAFDAMTSNRPYRYAMPPSQAINIIAEGAGTQWDEVCVDVFLKIMEEDWQTFNMEASSKV
ncbi:HD domain-containing phosphohydrolase [Saliterribacillus persicus]|uniref:HAMP domain-containing protein n=1 Tax=Saliterribacillus persicus TaxID=930114 RepID=A0A368XUV7_9BACI|nr:HD domain-containing phosphohydrolase [Saliterribacillus persicus]RCW69814.1 HAMP domain-containing protein [Saliterribacillus persicus]